MTNKNIINVSPNADGKQNRVCSNCSNILSPDSQNYGIYFCPTCGIRYNIKDTSPERQLKTYFAVNLDGSRSKIVQKTGSNLDSKNKNTSNTYLLEKELDRLHKKNIDAFDFLTGFIDNGMKITNIIININKKERNRNKNKMKSIK